MLGFRLALSNSLLALLAVLCGYIDNELAFNSESTPHISAALRIAVVLVSLLQAFLCIRYAKVRLQLQILLGKLHPSSNTHPASLLYEKGALLRLALEVALLSIVLVPFGNASHSVDSNGRTYEFSLENSVTVVIFLRIYHVFKFLYSQSQYHSQTAHFYTYSLHRALHGVSSRSFIVLSQMYEHPFLTLFVLASLVFSSAGLLVHTLERTATLGLLVYDGPWLVAVTQLTVGYGDIAPSTDWGRLVVIGPGLLGVLTLSLVVANATRRLALNRRQKAVVERLYNQWYLRRNCDLLACVYIQRRWRLQLARRKHTANRLKSLLDFQQIHIQFTKQYGKCLKDSLELEDQMQKFSQYFFKATKAEKTRLNTLKITRMQADSLSTKEVTLTYRIMAMKQAFVRCVGEMTKRGRRRSSAGFKRRHSSHRSSIEFKKESDLAIRKLLERLQTRTTHTGKETAGESL